MIQRAKEQDKEDPVVGAEAVETTLVDHQPEEEPVLLYRNRKPR